jgi:hypothetical protein
LGPDILFVELVVPQYARFTLPQGKMRHTAIHIQHLHNLAAHAASKLGGLLDLPGGLWVSQGLFLLGQDEAIYPSSNHDRTCQGRCEKKGLQTWEQYPRAKSRTVGARTADRITPSIQNS